MTDLTDDQAAILRNLPLQVQVPADRARLSARDGQAMRAIETMHGLGLCRRIVVDRSAGSIVIDVEMTALGVAELSFWRQARRKAEQRRIVRS